MTGKQQLTQYLEVEPKARERKNKDRAIVNVLLRRYPSLEGVDKRVLVDFVKDHNSMDRSWRQILEHREDLRGNDYGDKVELKQKKELELGYMPGYYRDLKQVNLL